MSSVCDLLGTPADEDVSDLLSLGADSKLMQLVLASQQPDHAASSLARRLESELSRSRDSISPPDGDVYGLLSALLTYSPIKRMSAVEALRQFCQTSNRTD